MKDKITMTRGRAFFFAAVMVVWGVVVGVCVQGVKQPAQPSVEHVSATLTQKDADKALAWLSEHMPNTHFTSARPSYTAPGLLRIFVRSKQDKQPSQFWFDPKHHLLLVGLVVNMNDPDARIAGGIQQ